MKKLSLLTCLLTFVFIGLNAQTSISDSDNTTRVETERTPNDDLIRFRVAGSDSWRMTGKRIEPLSSGNSVFIGLNAGANDDLTNNSNVFIGNEAGAMTTTGASNVALGRNALNANVGGSGNFGLGNSALRNHTGGNSNVAIGTNSLVNQTTGANNVGIGGGTNFHNTTGTNNVMIGTNAGNGGAAHSKSGNVFIGFNAGFNELGSNKLVIENSNSGTPLLYGEFDNDLIKVNGQTEITNELMVGVSTPAMGYLVSVNGKGIFTEVRVLDLGNWPDYVFQPDYNLMSLKDVDKFIKENGHLPNIPSAEQVGKEGIPLGGMNKNLVEKIEELTLYAIDADNKVETLAKENNELKNALDSTNSKLELLMKRIEELENK